MVEGKFNLGFELKRFKRTGLGSFISLVFIDAMPHPGVVGLSGKYETGGGRGTVSPRAWETIQLIQYTLWAVGVKVFSNESKDRKRDELLMINLWFSSRHCPSPSTMSTLDVFVRL